MFSFLRRVFVLEEVPELVQLHVIELFRVDVLVHECG